MAENKSVSVEEMGVNICVPVTKTTAERLKVYNPALATVREAVLCTLKIECEGKSKAVQCLDVCSNTGLVSMQWKKHLGRSVHVVASEPSASSFHSNCENNDQRPVDWPVDNNHRPGDTPKCQQSDKEIYVCPQNGNIALHKDAFHFAYIQPNGTTSCYLDSLFTHLRHEGVACLVSPDISSQCVRSAPLIQRQYHAHVIKTDYLREMAARIVIGAAARAAARYNKGIEVLYTISIADHLLIAVRVVRKQGENCVRLCRQVLHCLLCEERVVAPDTHTVMESPYKLLPCQCKEENPGRTAVVLGPMWCGGIFSVPYLEKLKSQVAETFPKSSLNSLLDLIMTEAKCEGMQLPRNNSRQTLSSNEMQGQESKEPIRKTQIIDNGKSPNKMQEKESQEPVTKKQKLENGDHYGDAKMVAMQQNTPSEIGSACEKCENNGDSLSVSKSLENSGEAIMVTDTGVNNADCEGKRSVTGSSYTQDEMPIFYHDLHKKKFHATVLPKSEKLITMLKSQGFRASRTHFDPTAIRTDANIAQMMQVMSSEQIVKK